MIPRLPINTCQRCGAIPTRHGTTAAGDVWLRCPQCQADIIIHRPQTAVEFPGFSTHDLLSTLGGPQK